MYSTVILLRKTSVYLISFCFNLLLEIMDCLFHKICSKYFIVIGKDPKTSDFLTFY